MWQNDPSGPSGVSTAVAYWLPVDSLFSFVKRNVSTL